MEAASHRAASTRRVAEDVLSVSDYAARLGSALRRVGSAVLEGEVQEPNYHRRSGMVFFDLTDGRSVLHCKVFRQDATRLRHRPANGDLVRVRVDRPDLHNGYLNLVVSDIKLAGKGALLAKRKQLLKLLESEGLTDPERWKPRPWLPAAVGVIAPADSKSMSDVLTALAERFPPGSAIACPALAQGLRAPRDLIDALARLDQHSEVEVIILARGGGSVEDLVAFDDEELCRAVFACSTPVIAAVGHTENIPVVNSVTWSAATPSRAPELAVPAAAELRAHMQRATQAFGRTSSTLRQRDQELAAKGQAIDVRQPLASWADSVGRSAINMQRSEERFFAEKQRGLERFEDALDRAPLKLPPTELLAALTTRLDDAVGGLFTETPKEVERWAAGLRRGGDSVLAQHGQGVHDQGATLGASNRRQLSAHRQAWHRERQRLAREVPQTLLRRLCQAESEITGKAAPLSTRSSARLSGVGRDIGQLARLIAAHDRRRDGWVLPRDASGQLVRFPPGAARGQRISLDFDGGRQWVTAREIQYEKENQDE